jgi:hypothetical protein
MSTHVSVTLSIYLLQKESLIKNSLEKPKINGFFESIFCFSILEPTLKNKGVCKLGRFTNVYFFPLQSNCLSYKKSE